MKRLTFFIIIIITVLSVEASGGPAKLAVVPGGDPKPDALLALAEAKLFEHKNIELLERTEIDKVLAEQKLSGMFDATNAVELGRILKTDIFAALETTSIVIFDAQTGLRFVDETLPEQIEDAVEIVSAAVKTAVEKRNKFVDGNLVTFGVLEVRNADFPVDRDAWCRAVAGMLERSLLHRGAAVLERSRLQHVNRERQLTGDATNDLLASMKLIDLEFTRGEAAKTFKITARIGGETFRAESLIDKPLDAVHKLVGPLLDGKELQENIDTKKEADRFLRESRVVQRISRYEEAVEKTETAAALDPENENIRHILASSLATQAFRARVFIEDYRWGRRTPPLHELRQALADVVRVQDIIETLPKDNYAIGYNLLEAGDYGGSSTHYMTRTRERLLMYATKNYPEFKNEVDQFNKRYLEFWMVNRYRPIAATEKMKSGDVFFNVIREGCFTIFTTQADIDLARCYEEILNDCLEIPTGNRMTVPYRSAIRFLTENIALLSGNQKKLPPKKRDASVQTILERIATTLENDSRPLFRHYAWIVRHNNGWIVSRGGGYQRGIDEDARRYFNLLRDHIADLPREETDEDINVLYESLRTTIPYCCDAWVAQQENFPFSLEILRLHDSRGGASPDTVSRAINDLPNSIEPKIPDDIRKSIPEYIKLIKRQIEQIERTFPTQATQLRTRLADKQWDIPPCLIPPWKDEVLLADVRKTNDMLYRPIIRGNKVFYFIRHFQKTVSLNTHDLATGVTIKSEPLPGYGPSYPWASSDIGRLCVDNVNAYCGDVDNGVLIFPLDGSPPWTFGPNEGLPSGYVQTIIPFHGKLYLGLGSIGSGKAREASWLVCVDLKTKEVEVLASSSGREGKAPFFNLSPPPTYHYFLDDPIRNRLLLAVSGGTPRQRTELTGLWAMDGETGQFTQLLRLSDVGSSYAFSPEGNRFIMFAANETALLDLSEEKILRTVLTSRLNGRKTPKPIIANCHAFDGAIFREWIWGDIASQNAVGIAFPKTGWGRIALDGKSECERLPIPKAIVSGQWSPDYCLPTPDGNGLIVGDGQHLILLRFE